MKSETKMIRPVFSGLVIIVTLSTCSLLKAQIEPVDPIPIGCYVDTTQDCSPGVSWLCSQNDCIPMWDDGNGGWTPTPIPGVTPVITCEAHSTEFTNDSVPYAAGTILIEGKESISVGFTVPCVFWQECDCGGKKAGESCSNGAGFLIIEELIESEAIGDDCDDLEI